MRAELDARVSIEFSESANHLIEKGAQALIEQGRREVLETYEQQRRREEALSALIVAGKDYEFKEIIGTSIQWLLMEAARRSFHTKADVTDEHRAHLERLLPERLKVQGTV